MSIKHKITVSVVIIMLQGFAAGAMWADGGYSEGLQALNNLALMVNAWFLGGYIKKGVTA